MRGRPTRSDFWAKLEEEYDQDGCRTGRILGWHPLIDHCADVAACFEALMSPGLLLRQRLARLMGWESLSDVHVARLCVLAALHDAGKANHGFQERALPDPRVSRHSHLAEFGSFLMSTGSWRERLREAAGLEECEGWVCGWQVWDEWLAATIGHHGRPVDLTGAFHGKDLWAAAHGREPLAALGELRDAVRRWFPAAFAEGDEAVAPFPGSDGWLHAFNGLLTLADWMGSHTEMFPFGSEEEGDRMAFARPRARALVEELHMDPTAARETRREERASFETVTGRKDAAPWPMQRICGDLETDGVDGSLLILESETGSGKTEAALLRFLRLYEAGQVDGLYFALPTRSAATQLFERVRGAVARVFPVEAARPPVVLAVPGYLQVDDQVGLRLPRFRVLWGEDAGDDHLRWRGWAAESPRQYFAAPIAVGTIDQALLSTLRVKYAHARAASLIRHLLVVDEVHASDAYMNRLLDELLRNHLEAGGHALLMSATLGSATRERFTAPSRRAPREALPLEEAIELAYPLVTFTDGRRSDQPKQWSREDAEPGGAGEDEAQEKEVRMELVAEAAAPREVAARALEAAAGGARVLVIRNTVKGCLATQLALEEASEAAGQRELLFSLCGQPVAHHSRFAVGDRRLLDEVVEASFGKESERGSVVAVATQTVEQSLDIDADLLITDLCPSDVLLQRIGRLHRHPKRARPAGFEEPRCVVLVPESSLAETLDGQGDVTGGAHGLGSVYEDLAILEATRRLVDEHPVWVIPRMNRELVERATHPEALQALCDELGEPWLSHRLRVEGATWGREAIASNALLDRSERYTRQMFPRQEDERLRTRLGLDDRRLEFDEPRPRGPFGRRVHVLTMPAWMAGEIEDDARPGEVRELDESFDFRFGSSGYRYDRLGLRVIAADDNNSTQERGEP